MATDNQFDSYDPLVESICSDLAAMDTLDLYRLVFQKEPEFLQPSAVEAGLVATVSIKISSGYSELSSELIKECSHFATASGEQLEPASSRLEIRGSFSHFADDIKGWCKLQPPTCDIRAAFVREPLSIYLTGDKVDLVQDEDVSDIELAPAA